MGTSWIIEGTVDDRWPINTRGNVGEVFPEVLTPLSYRLGVIAAERAWRNAYAELGVAVKGDFADEEPVIIGLYGGYAYLNLSYLRILGVRALAATAERRDRPAGIDRVEAHLAPDEAIAAEHEQPLARGGGSGRRSGGRGHRSLHPN